MLRFSFECSEPISNLNDQKPLQQEQKSYTGQSENADDHGVKQVESKRNPNELSRIVQKKQDHKSTDGIQNELKQEPKWLCKQQDGQKKKNPRDNHGGDRLLTQ